MKKPVVEIQSFSSKAARARAIEHLVRLAEEGKQMKQEEAKQQKPQAS